MRDGIPRPLLALTVVVVAVAVYIGVRDYQEEKHPKPAASAATAVQPKAKSLPKKITSAKTIRVRISAKQANVPATAEAKTAVVNDDGNPVSAGAAHDAVEVAMNRNEPAHNEFATETAQPILSEPQCVPLPNITKLRDADAPYYINWAKEYGCLY